MDTGIRSCRQEVFYKIEVLKNFAKFTGKQFCEIFQNTFFTEHLQTTASTASTFGKNGMDIDIILTILIR